MGYGIVMLFISLFFHKYPDFGVETDFLGWFVKVAQGYREGNIIIDYYRGPIYPVLLLLIGIFVADLFKAGIILSVLAASVTVYFVYKTTFLLFYSNKFSLVVVLLIISNKYFFEYTYLAGTDMVFVAFLSFAIYFILSIERITWKKIIILALITSLVYHTRYNGIFLIPAISTYIIFNNGILKSNIKNKVLMIFLYLSIFVVTLIPWSFVCYKVEGKFTCNDNYYNVAYDTLEKDQMSWDEFWFGGGKLKYTSFVDVIQKNPQKLITSIGRNAIGHMQFDLTTIVGLYVGLLGIVGLIVVLIKEKNKKTLVYSLINLFYFSSLWIVQSNARYSLFLIIFYSIFAVYIFSVLLKAGKNNIAHKVIKLLFVVLLIINILYSFKYNQEKIEGRVEILQIAELFRNQGINFYGEKITARKPHIAYELGMDIYQFPVVDTYEELLAELHGNKVKYLFFGEEEASRRPNLAYLDDPTNDPEGLELIVYTANPKQVIYEVIY